MKKIIIYADGSFKIEKQANAAIIIDKNNENDKTLIFRVGRSKNNQQAELNSVIYSLEYVKALTQVEGETFLIEINCDEISIVQFINKKLYMKWDKRHWRTGNRPIRTNIIHWYKLMLLIKHFGAENIKAIKVKTKKNKIHNIVDKVCHKILSEDFMNSREFYTVSVKEIPNIDTLINSSSIIKIQEITSDGSTYKMPWCEITHKNENVLESASWTIRIDEDILNIPTKAIILQEEIHLDCHKINFYGKLKEYSKQEKIENPIAVRKISDNKYALVMGIQRYFAAKILDIEVIPAIITDLNYADFSAKMAELINN